MDRELVNIASYMSFAITVIWFISFPLGFIKPLIKRIKGMME